MGFLAWVLQFLNTFLRPFTVRTICCIDICFQTPISPGPSFGDWSSLTFTNSFILGGIFSGFLWITLIIFRNHYCFCNQESLLMVFWYHIKCWELNLSRLHARQLSYRLYYFSGSKTIFLLRNRSIFLPLLNHYIDWVGFLFTISFLMLLISPIF